MKCLYCHHKDHLELDMHSDGYSSNLLECSECGALLKLDKYSLETIHGPTSPPFLTTRTVASHNSTQLG